MKKSHSQRNDSQIITMSKMPNAVNDSDIFRKKNNNYTSTNKQIISCQHYKLIPARGVWLLDKERFYLGENYRKKYLSAAEFRVFRYLILGLTAKHISKRLKLSPSTIEWHTRNILGYFDLYNKCEIGEFAVQHGFAHVWFDNLATDQPK